MYSIVLLNSGFRIFYLASAPSEIDRKGKEKQVQCRLHVLVLEKRKIHVVV